MIVELCNAALSKALNLDVSRFIQTVPRNIITGFKVSRCGSEVHLEVVKGREQEAFTLWEDFLRRENSKLKLRRGKDFFYEELAYLPCISLNRSRDVEDDWEGLYNSGLPEKVLNKLTNISVQAFAQELRQIEGFIGYAAAPYPSRYIRIGEECETVATFEGKEIVIDKSITLRKLVYGETFEQFEDRALEVVYAMWEERLTET